MSASGLSTFCSPALFVEKDLPPPVNISFDINVEWARETNLKTTIDVRLSGRFQVLAGGQASLLPNGRKACGILAYLCFNAGKPVSRARLIDLFWSNRGTAQGQASLRQSLLEIRRAAASAGVTPVETSRTSVVLRPENVRFDLWDKEGGINPNLCDPLLDGLDPISPVFDDWLDDCRRSVIAAQLRKAESALAVIDPTGDPEGATGAGSVILALDPTNEPASRAVIGGQIALGRESAAKREYERLKRALAEDGFEVSKPTNELFDTLKHSPQGARQPAPSLTAPTRTIPTIALVPMTLSGETPEITHLCDMVVEECLTRLAQVPEASHLGSGQPKR